MMCRKNPVSKKSLSIAAVFSVFGLQIYLPIAEVVVNSFTLVGLGGIVGLMSGLLRVAWV